MALAGRAAEEVVFGREELSSLNQHRIMFARQVSAVRGCGAGQGPVQVVCCFRSVGILLNTTQLL